MKYLHQFCKPTVLQYRLDRLSTSQMEPKYSLRYKLTNIHPNSLTSTVKISPDGSKFATCASDSVIKLWDLVNGGKLLTTFDNGNKNSTNCGISDIDFSPNGLYLASCSDNLTIEIWDLDFENVVKILKNHSYHVNVIRWDQRSRILISGSSDENIRIWDCKSGKSMRTLSAHSDPISSIDLSFDDTIIASGSYDGLIRLFDTQSGSCLKTLIYDKEGSAFPISYVKFSPNSKFVLSSSLDGVIRLWDYMNNRVVKTYRNTQGLPIAEKYTLSSNFIIYNNERMVCSGDERGSILFWDIQNENIRFQLKASELNSPIMQVDSFNDGQILVSVSLAGELCVWDYIE